jgi:hypothetical protein
VAFFCCDPAFYNGFLSAAQYLSIVISKKPVAVVLYSASTNACNFTAGGSIPSSYTRVYTMTSREDTYSINTMSSIQFQDSALPVYIGRRAQIDNVTSSSSNGSQNPVGPSPSTAVAMIILYSITGVITALFLIIIVTGAVRAHRHPERYGPRNVLGRPRQSRARGLARAMLETLPIVKFGEREDEEPKPPDVELARGAATQTEGGEAAGDANAAKRVTTLSDNTDTVTVAESSTDQTATATESKKEPDAAPGCSICTDDFERGQDVRVLPCDHTFHPACIDPWLLNVSGTCPLCRIDLRPAATRDETSEPQFPPPLDPDVVAMRRTSRRASGLQSGMWDLLNPVRMADATAQERLDALRHVREYRRTTPAEEAEARRRRRLTARLQDVFHIRTKARGVSSDEDIPEGTATVAASSSSAAPAAAAAAAPRTRTSSSSPTAISVERIPESEESVVLSPVAEVSGSAVGREPVSPVSPTETPTEKVAEEPSPSAQSLPSSGTAEQAAEGSMAPTASAAPATATAPAAESTASSSAKPAEPESSSSSKETPASKS